jgi:hypothetical protein
MAFKTTLDLFYSVFLDFSHLNYLSGKRRPFLTVFFDFCKFLHQKFEYNFIPGLKKLELFKEPKINRSGPYLAR